MGCQDFEAIAAAILLEQAGGLHSALQGFYLVLQQNGFGVVSLDLGQGIVHFDSCIQEGLLELEASFLLLRLLYLQVGFQTAILEDRLCQRGNGFKKHPRLHLGILQSAEQIDLPTCLQRKAYVFVAFSPSKLLIPALGEKAKEGRFAKRAAFMVASAWSMRKRATFKSVL